MGKHEVSLAEFDAPDTVWEKYEIWYPSNLKQSDQAYPVVVIANGTGMKASKQSAIYEHLASWGFIVAGNEDEHSRTGASSAATLDFILSLNEESAKCFLRPHRYGKHRDCWTFPGRCLGQSMLLPSRKMVIYIKPSVPKVRHPAPWLML